MDPRTAAKVTAPDLLEAFHEHAPNQDVVLDAELRVYLILTEGEKVVEALERGFDGVEVVLQRVRVHLSQGGENGAFIFTATSAPELFANVVKELSAPQG